MGFYHYLKAEKENGEWIDVGGYSKGGSQAYWLFAFSPTEYTNNLEEAVEENNWNNIQVGYTTSIGKAKMRLRKTLRRLENLREKPFLHQDKRHITELTNKILILLKDLHFLNDHKTLSLSQSDGAEYAIIIDENKQMVGLEEWWYNNEAIQNEKRISAVEKETVSLEHMIQDFQNQIINEDIPYFFGELLYIIAESERGYGPNEISQFLNSDEAINSNNPTTVYKKTMEYFLESMNKEEHSPTEKEIVYYNMILFDYIEETMDYIKSQQ